MTEENNGAPEELQALFIEWNAERLHITAQESCRRYARSLAAVEGGHGGVEFRKLNETMHELLSVFANDTVDEVVAAYQLFAPIHMLRMISYRTPAWGEKDDIVRCAMEVDGDIGIMDIGCGLAQQSRSLARYLQSCGRTVSLTLIDIPTIRKDFLLWVCERQGIKASFIDSNNARYCPELPHTNICVATEFFEHIHQPQEYFRAVDCAIKPHGILVTNLADHKQEFMHVSPKLGNLREQLLDHGYDELRKCTLYRKAK